VRHWMDSDTLREERQTKEGIGGNTKEGNSYGLQRKINEENPFMELMNDLLRGEGALSKKRGSLPSS